MLAAPPMTAAAKMSRVRATDRADRAPAETLLRALPVPALGIDREGIIHFVNRAAEALLGWREIELDGRAVLDALFQPEQRDLGSREMARVFDGEVRVRNATLRGADGREVEVELRASAVRNESGWVTGLVATLGPQTPTVEPTSASINPAEIARVLAGSPFLDRLSELVVDQLGDSDRARGDFLATMSHELRTPLHVILGYGGLLLEGAFGALPSPLRDPLARIHRRAHELHDLITNTLNLTRLETDGTALHIEPVALGGLLSELVSDVERTRDQGDAEISLEVDEDLPVIETDTAKLTIVLRNLIGNALKFTDEGWIRVRAHHDGSEVSIEVKDSGVGMSAEETRTLFAAYAQAEAGRARGGVGLGLYIVQQMTLRLGGTIEVESTPGEGSTFRLHLPLKARNAEAS